MTVTEGENQVPPLRMDGRAVTHRLIRHAKRTAEITTIHEGKEPSHDKATWYEAVCACGHVFTDQTDAGASAKYLDHLPKPTGQRGH